MHVKGRCCESVGYSCYCPVRIEPVFDEIALIGQVEEEFEDLLASPFANPLLEKTSDYFGL